MTQQRKRDHKVRSARNQLIIEDAIVGKNTKEIMEKYNISQPMVSKILTKSPEVINAKEMAKQRFERMLDDALTAIQDIVKLEEDPSNRLKAALAVFDRALGKVTDDIKINSQNINVGVNVQLSEEELIKEAKEAIALLEARKSS